MTAHTLTLTPHDPLVARDGRPFGAGQGYRMRGLSWPLPSVVAGSLRTALVKAKPKADFAGDTPTKLLGIQVVGVFPIANEQLYLPAPNDAVAEPNDPIAEPNTGGKGIKTVHRAAPSPKLAKDEGCDFPVNGLRPVMLTPQQAKEEFKPRDLPAWWPADKLAEWLTAPDDHRSGSWLADVFLKDGIRETRDHVQIEAETGAAKEGLIFATAGLSLTHLPRYSEWMSKEAEEEERATKAKTFADKFTPISLATRVTTSDLEFAHLSQLDIWHPLGGERRMVHWKHGGDEKLWECPETVRKALAETTEKKEEKKKVRMVLATPAIFASGWKPEQLDPATLLWKPFDNGPTLKLVGVSIKRWQAVSGWSLAPPRGPKAIRRMVPAGGVYFFETSDNAASLADRWLHPVSDTEQDRNDGFGLAVWGTW